jgi:uncharacterized RDD family membrane protein YckC
MTVSEWLVRARARRLPHALLDRFAEEWIAEVRTVDGRLAKLAFALGLFLTTNKSLAGDDSLSDGHRVMPTFDVHVYSDAFTRAMAYVLDRALLLVVFGPVLLFPDGRTWQTQLLDHGYNTLAYGAFYVYCVRRFGGTPGKLIMKLRIVAADGSPLTARHAILRSAPGFVRLAFATVSAGIAFSQINSAEFDALSFTQQASAWRQSRPSWHSVYATVWSILWLCDAGVCLLNDQRRSLRDYLAGTVVIVKDRDPFEVPTPTRSAVR